MVITTETRERIVLRFAADRAPRGEIESGFPDPLRETLAGDAGSVPESDQTAPEALTQEMKKP